MADDPRVEAAARAIYEDQRDASAVGHLWTDWTALDADVREEFCVAARAALAAADEVQAPEVERLRGEPVHVDATSYDLGVEDGARNASAVAAHALAEKDRLLTKVVAAEARYTALVEGVRGEVVEWERLHPAGAPLVSRILALLPTTEEGR